MRTDRTISVFLAAVVAVSLAFAAGCGGTAKVGPPTQPAVVGQPQPAPATQLQPAPAAANPAAISPELVQKVNDLVRLNKEYIALAETIHTLEDYKKNADELSRIEQQSSSLVEDVMIAEAKLSDAQKAEFNTKYFEGLAKPTIELKKQHTLRVQSLLR